MRIAIQSDSQAVARALSDLAALHGDEIVSADDPTATRLRWDQGTLTMQHGERTQRITTPVRLADLCRQWAQLAGSAPGSPVLLAHGWRFEPWARMLHGPQQQHVPLTEKESAVLEALCRAAGPISRESLLADVWRYAGDSETHTLETHLYRLRSKLAALEPRPCEIATRGGTVQLEREA